MVGRTTVTLPFFQEQVDLKQKPLKEKAKYMLFFVTEVVQLRTDGMEPSIIVERLADRGVGLKPLTKDEAVKHITEYFEECVKEGELRHHRRGDNPYAAYGFVSERTTKYFDDLRRGLQVFISHPGKLRKKAKRIADILKRMGVTAWLDIEHGGFIRENITEGINVQSCAVVFLITSDFAYREYMGTEIDLALKKKDRADRDRFAIIPIVLLKRGEKPSPELIEERVPKPLRDEQVACQWARDDADIIDHIIHFMPVRLNVAAWREGT